MLLCIDWDSNQYLVLLNLRAACGIKENSVKAFACWAVENRNSSV